MIRVYAISSPARLEPYLSKIKNFLDNNNEEYRFYLWDRENSKPKDFAKVVLQGAPTGLFSKVILYIRWFFSVVDSFCRDSRKGDVIFCSRFDVLLAASLANAVCRGRRLVYLDRDPAHLCWTQNNLLRVCLLKLERALALQCDAHVIATKSRDYTGGSNVHILFNSPANTSLAYALKSEEFLYLRSSDFTIYINGWFVSTRGMSLLYQSLRNLDSVRVVMAGIIECEDARLLSELPHSIYLGSLTSDESLEIYKYVDVVASFYDPSLKINSLAAPNKWYDCLCMGVPFISNSGILTVEPFVKLGVCFLVDYGDPASLRSLLDSLHSDRTLLLNAKKNIVKFDCRSWDEQFNLILNEVRNLDVSK